MISICPVVVAIRIFRIQLECQVIVCQCFVQILLWTRSVIAVCAVYHEDDVFRIQRHRFGVVGNGTVHFFFIEIGVAAIVVAKRIQWFQFDRFGVICDRLVVIPIGRKRIAAGEVAIGILRL